MEATFRDRLNRRIERVGNGICLGLDPDLRRIPYSGSPRDVIRRFYLEILEAMVTAEVFPAAVKPNSAYFECLGPEGMHALKDCIDAYSHEGIMVILDAKRADIERSSAAYAKAAFEAWGADAVTVSPYMGADSIEPFCKGYPGRGAYVLVLTSNPGSENFQRLELMEDGKPLYHRVAASIQDWGAGEIGAVIGATKPTELRKLLEFWQKRGRVPYCLVPGVSVADVAGGQGGNVAEIFGILHGSAGRGAPHLVNSSSGLAFAYERGRRRDAGGATVEALREWIALEARLGG